MTAQPALDTRASDPDAHVPRVSYRPVATGYVSGRPAEVVPWTGRNAAPADQERR